MPEENKTFDRDAFVGDLRKNIPEQERYTDNEIFKTASFYYPQLEQLPWKVKTPEPEQPDFWDGVGAITTSLYSGIVDSLPATVARSIKAGDRPIEDFTRFVAEDMLAGNEFFPRYTEQVIQFVNDTEIDKPINTWLDSYIKMQVEEGEEKKDIPDMYKDTGWITLPGFGTVAYRDLEDLGDNLGYSFAGMAATIVGTLTAGPIGGIALSTSLMYRASKDQYLSDIKNRYLQQYGEAEGLLAYEEMRPFLAENASWYAFWEAAPEALGNQFMFGVEKFGLKALKEVVGKSSAKSLQNFSNYLDKSFINIIARIGLRVGKAVPELGVEFATETLTQKKQVDQEILLPEDIRQRETAISYLEAFNEVKVAVLLQTLVMGSATNSVSRIAEVMTSDRANRIKQKDTVSKFKETLEKEITEKSPKTEVKDATEYDKFLRGEEFDPMAEDVVDLPGNTAVDKLFNQVQKTGNDAYKAIYNLPEEKRDKIVGMLGYVVESKNKDLNLKDDKGNYIIAKVLAAVGLSNKDSQQGVGSTGVGVEEDVSDEAELDQALVDNAEREIEAAYEAKTDQAAQDKAESFKADYISLKSALGEIFNNKKVKPAVKEKVKTLLGKLNKLSTNNITDESLNTLEEVYKGYQDITNIGKPEKKPTEPSKPVVEPTPIGVTVNEELFKKPKVRQKAQDITIDGQKVKGFPVDFGFGDSFVIHRNTDKTSASKWVISDATVGISLAEGKTKAAAIKVLQANINEAGIENTALAVSMAREGSQAAPTATEPTKPTVKPTAGNIPNIEPEWTDTVMRSTTGRPVAAKYNSKTGKIKANIRMLKNKWNTAVKKKALISKLKGIVSIPIGKGQAIGTFENFVEFSLNHERAHDLAEVSDIKDFTERENRANEIALESMGTYPVSAEEVSKILGVKPTTGTTTKAKTTVKNNDVSGIKTALLQLKKTTKDQKIKKRIISILNGISLYTRKNKPDAVKRYVEEAKELLGTLTTEPTKKKPVKKKVEPKVKKVAPEVETSSDIDANNIPFEIGDTTNETPETAGDNLKAEEDIEFQKVGASELAAENRTIAQKIIDRIKKHYPGIKLNEVQDVFDQYGIPVAGRAFRNIAEWSRKHGTLDTLAHEPFHIILKAFKSDPFIRLGIKKFAKSMMPDFRSGQYNTRHAWAYGLLNKGNKQVIANLRKEQAKVSKEAKADPTNSMLVFAAQFYREAAEAAEGTGSAQTAFNKGFDSLDTLGKYIDDLGVELLVQHVGEYYAGRIQQGWTARMNNWLKQLVLRLKKIFNPSKLSSKEIGNIIGEEYFKGNYIMSEDVVGDPSINYKPAKEVEGSNDPATPDDTGDTDPLVRLNRFFEQQIGIYLTEKDTIAIAKLAFIVDVKKVEDIQQFIDAKNNYLKGRFNIEVTQDKENPNFLIVNKDGVEKRISAAAYRNESLSFYQKINSSIRYYNADTAKNGKRSWNMLVHQEKFRVSKMEAPKFFDVIDGVYKNVIGQTVPSRTQVSFMDYLAKRGRALKFYYLSYKDIYKRVIAKDKTWMSKINPGDVEVNRVFIRKLNRMAVEDFKKTKQNLRVFFADYSGDNAQLVWAMVEGKYNKYNKAKAVKYFKQEVADKKMEDIHYNDFIEWGEAETDKDEVRFAQLIGYHEAWKSIFGQNYLKETKGMPLAKIFKRVKIPFNKGVMVKGAGDSKLMIVDFVNGGYELKVNKEPVDVFTEDGGYAFDGWQMVSGKYLKKLTELNGKVSAMVKAVISHTDIDGVSYLSEKMMSMTVFPQMEVWKDGKLVAQVKGTGRNTYWEDANGNEFDHLVTPDEVKLRFGKYKNMGEIYEISEHSIRVLIHPGSIKKTSAFPMLASDLLLNPDILSTKEAVEFYTELYDHFESIGTKYVGRFKNLLANPKALSNFVLKELKEGELPTELHRAAMADPGALLLPHYLKQLIPILTNKLISNGLLKGRPSDGFGTRAYFKPKVNLDVKDESVLIASDNTVLVKRVKEAVIADKGETVFAGMSEHNQIEAINNWLENNEFWALVHRQPIQAGTKVQMRKIQGFIEGFHGSAIFMNFNDVFRVHEGDSDGDSVAIEILPKKLEQAWINLQRSNGFKKVNKNVYTDIFAVSKEESRLSNMNHVYKYVEDNNTSKGAQGNVVSALTVFHLLSFKKIAFKIGKDSYGTHSLNKDVVLNDFKLDRDKLNGKMLENLTNQGDTVLAWVNKKYEIYDPLNEKHKEADLYLKTTKSNEFSILLQLAVDWADNGLLNNIPAKNLNEYLLSRMFTMNGKAIESGMAKRQLRAIYKAFNYSKFFNANTEKGFPMNVVEMYDKSKELADYYYDNDGTKKTKEELVVSYRKLINDTLAERKNSIPIHSLSMNDNVSPRERLLMTIYKNFGDNPIFRIYNGLEFNVVHVNARERMNKAIAGDISSRLTEKEYNYTKELINKMSIDLKKLIDAAEKSINTMSDKQDMETRYIDYDYTKDFSDFVEVYAEQFDNLNKAQKEFATLYYLNGVEMKNQSGKGVIPTKVRYLLPTLFMDLDVLGQYARDYNTMLKDYQAGNLQANAETIKNVKPTIYQWLNQEGVNGFYC